MILTFLSLSGCIGVEAPPTAPLEDQYTTTGPEQNEQTAPTENPNIDSTTQMMINQFCPSSDAPGEDPYIPKFPGSVRASYTEDRGQDYVQQTADYCIHGNKFDKVVQYVKDKMQGWNLLNTHTIGSTAISMAGIQTEKGMTMEFEKRENGRIKDVQVEINLIKIKGYPLTLYTVSYNEAPS